MYFFDLIKKFEGCVLKVYLDPVGVPTCGYGHTAGLTRDMVGQAISSEQAELFLKTDLIKFEKAVNDTGIKLNQNQFDALVSFAFNCGAGNLKKLVKGRSLPEIADAMLSYNKAKGKILPGLMNRRKAERELFVSNMVEENPNRNPYPEPTKNVKLNSRGNDVRWLQFELNRRGFKLIVDGVFGSKTLNSLMSFQKDSHILVDGICGPETRKALKS